MSRISTPEIIDETEGKRILLYKLLYQIYWFITNFVYCALHNVLLIYLILEHTEAEKEDESALRTPTPESDEPTEGNVYIYIDELYLYVKKHKGEDAC